MMVTLSRGSRETSKNHKLEAHKVQQRSQSLIFMMPSKKRQDSITYRKDPEILRTKVDIFLFNFPKKGGLCLNMGELC